MTWAFRGLDEHTPGNERRDCFITSKRLPQRCRAQTPTLTTASSPHGQRHRAGQPSQWDSHNKILARLAAIPAILLFLMFQEHHTVSRKRIWMKILIFSKILQNPRSLLFGRSVFCFFWKNTKNNLKTPKTQKAWKPHKTPKTPKLKTPNSLKKQNLQLFSKKYWYFRREGCLFLKDPSGEISG